MGIFDLFKKKTVSFSKESVHQSELKVHTKSIPLNVKELLFISKKRSEEFEPSEIITSLPVKKGKAESLGYYPSYYEMSPEQRHKYLEFLMDITSTVDIGYVFVFYYGLEKRIYMDDHLYEAVEMILKLQERHKNRSFLAYSNDALIYAAMMKKDPNIILNINLETLRPELLFLVKGSFIGEFNAKDLMSLSKGVEFSNNRYIKSNPDMFQKNLTNLIVAKYESENYILDKTLKLDTNKKIKLMLSNISIMNREFEYPNFLVNSKVQADIFLLLKEAHEITKKELSKSRITNNTMSNSTNKKLKKETETIFIPDDNLSLKERIILSKEPKTDGFEEEIKGIELYKQGKYKESEEFLLRSVKGEFNAPALYERLGILYRKQKRYDDEVEILKIGIKNVGLSKKLNERLANAIVLNEKQKLKNS